MWSDQPAAHAAAQERAKRRKLAESSDPQARERREAASALQEATLGTDEETLYAAIQWASAIGVAPDILESARKRHEALTVAPAQEQERDEAEAALQAVLISNDSAAITAAIARAEEAAVAPELVEKAKLRRVAVETQKLAAEERQQQQQALQAVRAAAASTNLQEVLNVLTRAAYLGVPRHQMEPALRRKAQLERDQQGRMRTEALQNLHVAVSGKDIAELAAAIEKAAAAGIDPQDMFVARARLQELRQARTTPAASSVVAAASHASNPEANREVASKALTAAVRGTDLQALLQAIMRAKGAGVDAAEVWSAEQRRSVLEAQLRERLLQTFAPGV